MPDVYSIRLALHALGYPTIRQGEHYIVCGLALWPSNALCELGLRRLWEGLSRCKD